METIFITDRIDFRFAPTSHVLGNVHTNVNGDDVLESRVHNILVKYYTYSIGGGCITIKQINPMNIDFIVQLVNGIES